MSYALEWILGTLLIVSAIGVIIAKKPVHASLSFLFTLFVLAVLYLQLSAQFIAVMQVLIYAGAILVLFMFVIVLFQDAHQQIVNFKPQSDPWLITIGGLLFLLTLFYLGAQLLSLPLSKYALPEGYGFVESLGQTLYIDFFFPFEAVTLLFIVAAVGALYIGKRVR